MAELGGGITQAGNRNTTRVQYLIDAAIDSKPIQVRTDFYDLSRGVNGKFPSIMLRPGQFAGCEVVKEYFEVTEDEVLEAFVVVRLEVTSEVYGLGERSVITYTHVEKPDLENLERYQKSKRLDDLALEQFEIKERVVIKNAVDRLKGQPSLISVRDKGGELRSLSLTTQRIEAAGRPVSSE